MLVDMQNFPIELIITKISISHNLWFIAGLLFHLEEVLKKMKAVLLNSNIFQLIRSVSHL